MSDSNCGARKNRNVRDHLFVVHGVINDVINGKAEPTALQIYDVKQCFDAMWFKKAMNNLYDVDMNDDHFSLLSETNLKSNIKLSRVKKFHGVYLTLLCYVLAYHVFNLI